MILRDDKNYTDHKTQSTLFISYVNIQNVSFSRLQSISERYVTPPFSRSGVAPQAARDLDDLVDSVYVFCQQTNESRHDQSTQDPTPS